jgi:hypothetical protein
MIGLPELCRELTLHKTEIIRDFNAATARTPWTELQEEERINYLRHLIQPVLRLTLFAPGNVRLSHRAIIVASHHGDTRRRQGFTDDILLDDFHQFGQLIVLRLARADPGTPETDAFRRIEGMLSVSYFASLRGYHRPSYEAQGRWPQTLEALNDDLPLYCP